VREKQRQRDPMEECGFFCRKSNQASLLGAWLQRTEFTNRSRWECWSKEESEESDMNASGTRPHILTQQQSKAACMGINVFMNNN